MRRRSRRGLSPVVAVWVACTALVGGVGATLGPEPPDDDLVQRGGGVYQAACAACHGSAGLGGVGTGLERGPALADLELAYIDQVLRTGRMPIAAKELGVLADRLDDEEREALVAFFAWRFGTDDEIPTVGPGDAARGHEVYVRNCAACHGAQGTGGIVGGGVEAPAIATTDPVAVAEAVRVGPFEMPAFSAEVLDDEQLDDVIAYLQAADATPRTALLGGVDDVVAAVAAIVLTGSTLWLLHRQRRHGGGEDPPVDAPGAGSWT